MAEIIKLKEGNYGYKIKKGGITIIQDRIPFISEYEPMTKKLASSIAYIIEKLMEIGEYSSLRPSVIFELKNGKDADQVLKEELSLREKEHKEDERFIKRDK